MVIITSNRTRELHDALKRRCLYHWLDYPEADREFAIVRLVAVDRLLSQAHEHRLGEVIGLRTEVHVPQLAVLRNRRQLALPGHDAGQEIGQQSVALAEEMTLTMAELA